jgi:hypothetical protein
MAGARPLEARANGALRIIRGSFPILLTALTALCSLNVSHLPANATDAVSSSIREFIAGLGIVDIHEHHMPEVLLSREVNLLQLFQQSYAGWTQARPYPLPSETRDRDPMLTATAPTTWEALQPYLQESGSNSFVRNLVRAITELYESAAAAITRENWESIDAAVRQHQRVDWCSEVLRRAGIERVITDPYNDPLLDARQALGRNYNSVMRINAFACGWHPESRDHNGNSARALLSKLGLEPSSFGDYLAALEKLVDGMASRHQIALKNALAYDRDVAFDEPNEKLARQAWGNVSPSPAARKAFSDFVVDRFCRLAAERNLPMQMHLGTAIIRGSHPLKAAGLIERHPGTRFLLMHLAYPWSRDLLGMAFVYRNIWLDLTWSLLLSPSHFKLALHEAIEILPDESRMMIGGDNWHIEETYGTLKLARQLIGEVLEEKIASGYFRADDARRLATKILRENAIRFFKLD